MSRSGLWRAAVSGAGGRPWWVCRDRCPEDRGRMGTTEGHSTGKGDLIRFASREAAVRRADMLNRKAGQ